MSIKISKIIDQMCELEAYIEFLENRICGVLHTNSREADIENYNKSKSQYKSLKKKLNNLSK